MQARHAAAVSCHHSLTIAEMQDRADHHMPLAVAHLSVRVCHLSVMVLALSMGRQMQTWFGAVYVAPAEAVLEICVLSVPHTVFRAHEHGDMALIADMGCCNPRTAHCRLHKPSLPLSWSST